MGAGQSFGHEMHVPGPVLVGPWPDRRLRGAGGGTAGGFVGSHLRILGRAVRSRPSDGAGDVHAVTAFLRGRPRGRFLGTTTPWTNRSPPQTPQGSRRSFAPARQASRSGQVRHSDLAYSTSSGDSAKNTSGSPVRQGTSSSRRSIASSSSFSVNSEVTEVSGSGGEFRSGRAVCGASGTVSPRVIRLWSRENRRAADPGVGSAALEGADLISPIRLDHSRVEGRGGPT